jgi:ribosomal protein S18 acetylase RimI-like enzyme
MAPADATPVMAVVRLLHGPEGWFSETGLAHLAIDLKFHRGWVAEHEGRIVGFLTAFTYEGIGHLGWMGVVPALHRRGIGRQLLGRFEAVMREAGISELEVYTLGDSVAYPPYVPTRAFYRALGFVAHRREKRSSEECPEALYLRKRLPPGPQRTPTYQIDKLDHEQPEVQQRIFDYLAPHEPHALFLLGNLAAKFPGSHLYAARDAVGRWAGIVGYYEGPRSLVPFATDSSAAAALARHAVGRHPDIVWLNGPGFAARPALAEVQALGYALLNDPAQVFMERPLPDDPAELPRGPHEDHVRPMCEADAAAVARLLRELQGGDDGSPLTADERARALRFGRWVLEAEGQIAATATTNGLGLRAFQILGVATHPGRRRCGYARSVCAALTRQMHAAGARHAVLFTGIRNVAARACYEGLGFAVTGDFLVAKLQHASS